MIVSFLIVFHFITSGNISPLHFGLQENLRYKEVSFYGDKRGVSVCNLFVFMAVTADFLNDPQDRSTGSL